MLTPWLKAPTSDAANDITEKLLVMLSEELEKAELEKRDEFDVDLIFLVSLMNYHIAKFKKIKKTGKALST